MEPNIAKIKKEMKRQNLSQEALADKMGLTRQRISAMLRQRYPLKIPTLNAIAKALDIDPKDLII